VIPCALAVIASCQVNVRLSATPSVMSTRKLGAKERSPFDSTNIESRTTLHRQQHHHHLLNNTAELSQRRPRDAPNKWVPWKFSRVLTTHPATFPETCNGLLFPSILRMCVKNLKFVALPVPEITGGTQKIWAVPGYAHAPFSPKILKGFCLDGPCEYICQIWRSYLYPFLR